MTALEAFAQVAALTIAPLVALLAVLWVAARVTSRLAAGSDR